MPEIYNIELERHPRREEEVMVELLQDSNITKGIGIYHVDAKFRLDQPMRGPTRRVNCGATTKEYKWTLPDQNIVLYREGYGDFRKGFSKVDWKIQQIPWVTYRKLKNSPESLGNRTFIRSPTKRNANTLVERLMEISRKTISGAKTTKERARHEYLLTQLSKIYQEP